jgi:hypothetical protein
MIKKAKNLQVGDVIYIAKYNATAVVEEVTKHSHYIKPGCFWVVSFIQRLPSAGRHRGLTLTFEDRYLIPVIGQAKIN